MKREKKRYYESKSKYDKKIWANLRNALLEKFGNKCVKCDFLDQRALHIDHVKGGGAKDKKRFSCSRKYYTYLLNEGSKYDYQILCANCNMIKKFENLEFRKRDQ